MRGRPPARARRRGRVGARAGRRRPRRRRTAARGTRPTTPVSARSCSGTLCGSLPGRCVVPNLSARERERPGARPTHRSVRGDLERLVPPGEPVVRAEIGEPAGVVLALAAREPATRPSRTDCRPRRRPRPPRPARPPTRRPRGPCEPPAAARSRGAGRERARVPRRRELRRSRRGPRRPGRRRPGRREAPPPRRAPDA